MICAKRIIPHSRLRQTAYIIGQVRKEREQVALPTFLFVVVDRFHDG